MGVRRREMIDQMLGGGVVMQGLTANAGGRGGYARVNNSSGLLTSRCLPGVSGGHSPNTYGSPNGREHTESVTGGK